MGDQQGHQSRQIHPVETSVGLPSSPFLFHSVGSLGGSLGEQNIGQYDNVLHRQHQQQMHQHIAAVSHLQQSSQMIPQMIHITGQQMHQAMQMQEQSFQYFQPVSLSVPTPRAEDVPRTSNISYPINSIFVSADDKNCCLKDRGTRCSRPAGTAGFTHRIRDLVSRSGALLTEDANAGHQYICDHHKNYIQKLRVILPPGTYLPSGLNHTGVPSIFSPFSTSSFSVETLMQFSQSSNMPSEPEDYSTNDGNEAVSVPTRTGTSGGHPSTSAETHKKKEHAESNSGAVDMRKVSHSSDARNSALRVSPEKDSSNDSSDDYDGGPAASDLVYCLGDIYSMEDLVNYVKHFEIDVPTHPTKEELARVVCEHMDTVPVNDVQSTLTNFFHAVKTDTRPFHQPYKQSLGVGFDLSSDEEMMLIDGKDGGSGGVMNGDTLSGGSDAQSDSDLEEDVNADEGLTDVQFDMETQRALTEINGRLPVAEIERILGRYSLPVKHILPAHESDTESSSSDERKPVKRSRGSGVKKRRRAGNSDD